MKMILCAIALASCSFITIVEADQQCTFGQVAPSHEVVRRAAFDIGSGKIKMEISDVDVTVNKITNVVFSDTANVALREDLAKSLDGRFSLEIQNKTI